MTYSEVMERVRIAALEAGRRPEEVTVVAVAKTKSPEEIMYVYDQGHRDFGENRAGEMAEKAAALPRDIRWHFVGALQSNKARVARPNTHLLHSMDRMSLARAWLKGPGTAPPVLLQVNVGGEETKSGIDGTDAEILLSELRGIGVDVRGLMAIPPAPSHPEDSRPYFVELRALAESLRPRHPNLEQLSMGMTDDFEVAIEEGASLIRVGRAIFGSRN